MAVQTYRPASVLDGQAYVEFRYDDTNNLVNLVSWANNSTFNVRYVVVDASNQTVIDTTLAPGASGSLTLTGSRRIKWDTDAYRIQLSVPPQ